MFWSPGIYLAFALPLTARLVVKPARLEFDSWTSSITGFTVSCSWLFVFYLNGVNVFDGMAGAVTSTHPRRSRNRGWLSGGIKNFFFLSRLGLSLTRFLIQWIAEWLSLKQTGRSVKLIAYLRLTELLMLTAIRYLQFLFDFMEGTEIISMHLYLYRWPP